MHRSPAKPRSRALPLAAAVLAIFAAASTNQAAVAEQTCKPVFGPFQSAFADPAACQPGALFCTQGKVIGGLVGDFRLNVFSQFPSEEGSSVFFFVGESEVATRPNGDLLIGTDTGAIDLNPFGDGHFGTLLTFGDGTGAFAGASGHIVINGNADTVSGVIMGDYKGEVCAL